MVGSAVRERRLYVTEIVRPRRGINGTTPRVSRTGGEDRRPQISRSRAPALAAGRNGDPAHLCPTLGVSWLRDSNSSSGGQFASGAFRRVRRHDRDTLNAGFQ